MNQFDFPKTELNEVSEYEFSGLLSLKISSNFSSNPDLDVNIQIKSCK